MKTRFCTSLALHEGNQKNQPISPYIYLLILLSVCPIYTFKPYKTIHFLKPLLEGRPEQIFFLLVTSIFPREFSRKSLCKKQFCKKTSLQLCHSRCRKQVSRALKWVQIKAFSSTHFLPAAVGSMIELEW